VLPKQRGSDYGFIKVVGEPQRPHTEKGEVKTPNGNVRENKWKFGTTDKKRYFKNAGNYIGTNADKEGRNKKVGGTYGYKTKEEKDVWVIGPFQVSKGIDP